MLRNHMNNPKTAEESDDILLLALNLNDILKEGKAPLVKKSIFTVEKVKIDAQRKKVKKKGREQVRECVGDWAVEGRRRWGEVEMKTTGGVPIVISPVFRFIKDWR
eukprot:TRINITY_DN10405_c0_g1_i1.p2 TRINITY_DN10405_c0_g1~~TRINITY_DN10405_c0_g1_i1.p2  ORF type:complete len:106 (+),score=21.47 TRINITY_DN10405_c0_g1_i1:384-701(+)